MVGFLSWKSSHSHPCKSKDNLRYQSQHQLHVFQLISDLLSFKVFDVEKVESVVMSGLGLIWSNWELKRPSGLQQS
uniref:Uncharacterized protein n=1 Tax=Cucumis melo TaxID=3656 RepID=A0A9I9ED59_CUCME